MGLHAREQGLNRLKLIRAARGRQVNPQHRAGVTWRVAALCYHLCHPARRPPPALPSGDGCAGRRLLSWGWDSVPSAHHLSPSSQLAPSFPTPLLQLEGGCTYTPRKSAAVISPRLFTSRSLHSRSSSRQQPRSFFRSLLSMGSQFCSGGESGVAAALGAACGQDKGMAVSCLKPAPSTDGQALRRQLRTNVKELVAPVSPGGCPGSNANSQVTALRLSACVSTHVRVHVCVPVSLCIWNNDVILTGQSLVIKRGRHRHQGQASSGWTVFAPRMPRRVIESAGLLSQRSVAAASTASTDTAPSASGSPTSGPLQACPGVPSHLSRDTGPSASCSRGQRPSFQGLACSCLGVPPTHLSTCCILLVFAGLACPGRRRSRPVRGGVLTVLSQSSTCRSKRSTFPVRTYVSSGTTHGGTAKASCMLRSNPS